MWVLGIEQYCKRSCHDDPAHPSGTSYAPNIFLVMTLLKWTVNVIVSDPQKGISDSQRFPLHIFWAILRKIDRLKKVQNFDNFITYISVAYLSYLLSRLSLKGNRCKSGMQFSLIKGTVKIRDAILFN